MSFIEAGEHYPIRLQDLPSGWETTFVGDAIHDIQPGFASGIHNQDGVGIPHLRPMNINKEGCIDLSVVKFVSPDNPLRVRQGDVLFNNTNSPELIGKTTSIEREGGWAFSNHMTRLRPPGGLSAKFVAHQLHYLWVTGYFRHRCTHHVNQASIASKTLAETVPLVVSPTNEQHRIVEEIERQFTQLDAGVAALKRAQANLKRYRSSVLKAACEGRLVPTEAELARTEGRDYEPADQLLARILTERRAKWEADQLAKMQASDKVPKDDKWKARYQEPAAPDTSELPELPEGWGWANLLSIAELKGGITKGQKRLPNTVVRAVPYLRVANVQRGFLDLSEMKEIDATEDEIKELKLLPGDVLFNEGGDRDKLGRGWLWRGEIPECIHQNHVFRARFYLSEVQPKFISWYGNSFGQQYFVNEGKQTTNLASINLTKLGALPVPLPPINEQARIVAEVESRLSIIDELEATIIANLKRAERLRQSILKQAFEGKLVPQDSTDEPASVLLERIRTERAQRETEHKTTKKPAPTRLLKTKKPQRVGQQGELFS